VLHDLALREIARDNQTGARQHLAQAEDHFRRGLQFAYNTQDEYEQLHILTELAFVADDLAELDPAAGAQLYNETIPKLETAILTQKQSTNPLYQLSVFEHQLELEKAAFAYSQGKYAQALDWYVLGYAGLASDAGYGSAKYLDLVRHLQRQIENLEESAEAVRWCDRFINTWDAELVRNTDPPQTLSQAHPDLIRWCRVQKSKRGEG
jgi:hypothetical protein